jgi:predicted nucleotidyltransferase
VQRRCGIVQAAVNRVTVGTDEIEISLSYLPRTPPPPSPPPLKIVATDPHNPRGSLPFCRVILRTPFPCRAISQYLGPLWASTPKQHLAAVCLLPKRPTAVAGGRDAGPSALVGCLGAADGSGLQSPEGPQAMRRDEVLRFLSFHRQELMERFGVCSLALFGSVARDEAGPDSDVDILVEFRETPGLSEYMGLKFWIEDRLGRHVDLVMEKALKSWARPWVEAEAIRVA